MVYKVVKNTERKYYKYKSTANGYRELASADFTNQPSLDTGITCNSNLKMIFDFIPREITGDVILGDFSGSDNEDYRFFNWENMIFFDVGSARIYGNECRVGTRYKFEFGNYYVKEYGASSNLLQGSTQTYSSAYTIKIKSSITFYSLQIYDGNTFIGDFTPCERVSDNVVGLYNKITDEFITVTSGNVIKGNYIIEEGTSSDYDYYEDVDVYKIIQKTERKYYKYGTPTYNVNIVGNLVNTDGVLSNFSASNYATLPQNFNPGISPWEMQFKFTTDNNFSQERCIFSQARASNWRGIKIDRDIDHTWIAMTGLNDAITGSFLYDYNKTYWLRLSYDGNGTYKLQISEDGINWVLDIQKDNENEISYTNVDAYLGWMSPEPNRYWKNTIDLNGCYIKIDGQTFWEGATTPILPGTEQDYDFYEDVPILVGVPWIQPTYSNWIGNNNATWDTSRLYTCTCDGSYNSSAQPGVASLAGSRNGWHSMTSSLPHWVGYYTEPIKVSKFGFQVDGNTSYVPVEFQWQGSNDGNDWITLGTFTRDNSLTSYEEYIIPEGDRDFYKFNRLYITRGNSNYQYICNLQMTATVGKPGYSAIQKLISN